MLIADLPDHENEQFQIVKYGLYALKHSYNNGLRFHNFRVPGREPARAAPQGDGLTIAYHGLNLGRVALCATAAGTMRAMLAEHAALGRIPQDLRRRRSCTRELVQPRGSAGWPA